MSKTLPHETSPDEVILRIEGNLRNPNVGRVVSTVLKDGPRAYRVATLYQIINPSTNEHHHWCLKINSFDRSKKTGWSFKPTHSLLMDDDGSQELAHLADLIQAAEAGRLTEPTGEYHLIPATQIESIKMLLRFAKRADSAQRMRVVRTLLENLDVTTVEPGEWLKVFEAGSEGVRQTIAVSARLAEGTPKENNKHSSANRSWPSTLRQRRDHRDRAFGRFGDRCTVSEIGSPVVLQQLS